MVADVFVSKPNTLNPSQSEFWAGFREALAIRGFRPRTLGDTDYPNEAPIAAVLRVMNECQGAIALGLTQVEVRDGIARRWTNREEVWENVVLPTAWNQIEGGIAFALGLPLLIVREPGIGGGLFDVGSSDRFVHQATLSREWLSTDQFLQPFRQWAEEVEAQR
jgi:hypothetical protein